MPECVLQQSLDTHFEGFADIGITTDMTSDSALHALCLRSWPAVRTVSLDLTASDSRYIRV